MNSTVDSKQPNNNPLDSLFRDKLSDAPEIQPGAEWPVLEKRLDAYYGKSKRRFIIIIFFSFLLAGLYWAAGDVLFSRNTDPVAESSKQPAGPNSRKVQASQPIKEESRERQEDNNGGFLPGNESLPVESIADGSLPSARTGKANRPARSSYIAKKPASRKNTVTRKAIREQAGLAGGVQPTDLPTATDSSAASEKKEAQTAALLPKRSPEKKKPAPPVVQPEEQASKESFLWVDLHVGVKRTRPLLEGEGIPGYFEKRNAEEHAAFCPTAGIDMRIQLRKLILSLGVELVNYGEDIDYTATAKRRFYYNSGGQMVYRDSTVNDPALVKQSKNKFTYLEFPLQGGYHFPSKGKFGASVTGGVAFGFLAGSDIQYVDTALNNVVQFSDHYIEHFRQQSFSLLLHPSFEYRMKNLSEIYISLQLRYQLSSVFKKKYEVKQQYFSPGVTVGYRFHRKQ